MIAKTMEQDTRVNNTGTTVNNITVEWKGDIDSPDRTRQLAQVIADEMTELQRNGFVQLRITVKRDTHCVWISLFYQMLDIPQLKTFRINGYNGKSVR